jgi:hypothetical protein
MKEDSMDLSRLSTQELEELKQEVERRLSGKPDEELDKLASLLHTTFCEQPHGQDGCTYYSEVKVVLADRASMPATKKWTMAAMYICEQLKVTPAQLIDAYKAVVKVNVFLNGLPEIEHALAELYIRNSTASYGPDIDNYVQNLNEGV